MYPRHDRLADLSQVAIQGVDHVVRELFLRERGKAPQVGEQDGELHLAPGRGLPAGHRVDRIVRVEHQAAGADRTRHSGLAGKPNIRRESLEPGESRLDLVARQTVLQAVENQHPAGGAPRAPAALGHVRDPVLM